MSSNIISLVGALVSVVALAITLVIWHADRKDKETQGEILRKIGSGVDKYDFILREMMHPLLDLVKSGMEHPTEAGWEQKRGRLTQVMKYGLIIKRIYGWESEMDFVALKWVRETKLKDQPELLELFQEAIDQGLLSTTKRANPYKPQYPTTCCNVNLKNPIVKEILKREKS